MTRKDPPLSSAPEVSAGAGVEPLGLAAESEYGPLEVALVHRPGPEMDRLTPDGAAAFLFDDLPRPDRLRREHDAFVRTLEDEGVRVLRLEDLLLDVLRDEATRRRLLRAVCDFHVQRSIANELIDSFGDDPARVLALLLTGITARELAAEANVHLQSDARERDFFVVRPLPHCFLTRDPGAVAGRQVVCANMHFDVRAPEPLLLRTILSEHPLFRGVAPDFGADRSSQRPFTLEGGDILVLSGEAVAVGCSERTRSASIHLLAERLFDVQGFLRIYEINVPPRRGHVHLDSMLAVIDRNRIVVSSAAMERITEVIVYEPYRIGDRTAAIPVRDPRPLPEILETELRGGPLDRIDVDDAGDAGADGGRRGATGVLAIGPSRVIAYDRHPAVNRALRERGVDVLEIEGDELARGHGGPRSLALPLRRGQES